MFVHLLFREAENQKLQPTHDIEHGYTMVLKALPIFSHIILRIHFRILHLTDEKIVQRDVKDLFRVTQYVH